MTTPLISIPELHELYHTAVHCSLTAQFASANRFSGDFRGVFRGMGMELEDSRPYVPGDDLRHLDWRATARAGRPVTKIFREERQRQVVIVFDRHPGMNFGSRWQRKGSAAISLAALLGFRAFSGHDPLTGVILEQEPTWFHARRHFDSILRFLVTAAAPLPRQLSGTGDERWHHLFQQIAVRLAGNQTVYLLSDFHDFPMPAPAELTQLQRRHTLVAIHVVDAGEAIVPRVGLLRLADPATGRRYVVDSSSPELADRVREKIHDRWNRIERLFHRHAVAYLRLFTHDDIGRRFPEVW